MRRPLSRCGGEASTESSFLLTNLRTRIDAKRSPRRLARLATAVALLVLLAGAVPALAGAVTVERTSSATFYVDSSTFSDTFPKLRGGYTAYTITNDGGTARDDVWVRADSFTGSVVALAPNEDPLVHIGPMAAGETRTAFFYLQATAATGSGQHTIRVFDGRPGAGGAELGSSDFGLTVQSQGFNNANKVESVSISPSNPSLGGLVTVVVQGETGTIGSAKILSYSPASDVSFPARSFRLESTVIVFNQKNATCPDPTKNCATVADRLLVPTAAFPTTQNTLYTATYTFRAVNVVTGTTAISPLAYISSGSSPSHTSTGSFASLPPVQPVENTLTLAKSADRSLVNATASSRTVEYTVTVSNTSSAEVGFDDFVDTLPAGASFVSGSASWNGTPLDDPHVAGGKATFVASFTVPAGSSGSLAYSLLLAATNGVAANSVVAHSSDTQIDTTLDTTDDAPASASVTVDVTPPALTLTSHPPQATSSTGATFAFTVDDPFAALECRGPGDDDWSPCLSPVSYSGLSEGDHAFAVRATDTAGNVTETSHEWTVDTTPPTLSLSGPAEPSGSHDATFTFASNEPGTFLCRLDDGDWEPCESPLLLTDLPNGEHTFEVRALDAAGNEDGGSVTWTVDGPPLVLFLDKPPSFTSSTTADFAFVADRDGATFECRFGDGEWEECESPVSLAGLDEGTYGFSVRATVGGETGDPSSHSWTVDLQAPAVQIDDGPDQDSPVSQPTFSFSSPDDPGATFECALDDGDYESCASPHTVGPLADGEHTLSVRAKDAAGNLSEPVSYTWTVDASPPAVTLDEHPPVLGSSAAATFAFSADDPEATFECVLDPGEEEPDFAPCASPLELELADGDHTFLVRARDGAGNAGEAVAFTWTIDTEPPAVAIGSGPGEETTATDAILSFVAEAGAALECALDGNDFASCESPVVLGGLAPGAHVFVVRATDAAGNAAEAEWSWTVLVPPVTVAFDETPAELSTDAAPTFRFSADDDAATFECRLDDGEWEPCASPLALAGLADGEHTLFVRASNGEGTSDPVSFTWTLDTEAPDVAVDELPPVLTNTTLAVFSFATGDADASFECALDPEDAEPTFAPCSSPFEATVGDGEHALHVRARDPAGNVSTTLVYVWTVDTEAPAVAIDSGPADSTSTAGVFVFGSDDGTATFECRLDEGEWEPCESPLELTGLGAGEHELLVRATDSAGNMGDAASHRWAVTSGAPPAPRLSLSTAGAPPFVTVSRTGQIRIRVVNEGDAPAAGVAVVVALPAGLELVSVTWRKGVDPAQACPSAVASSTCAVGSLAPAAEAEAVLSVRPKSAGTFLVAATASADGLEADSELELSVRSSRCTIEGTPGDDVLVGTPGADVICGFGGNDRISGLGGNDLLLGGPGDDRLVGGAGNDRLAGGPGRDVLHGGTGNDRLRGGAGNDLLIGGIGDDRLRGQAGNDVIWGWAGFDVLFGGPGNDEIHSHDGEADRIVGGPGRDRWIGDRLDRAAQVESRRLLL